MHRSAPTRAPVPWGQGAAEVIGDAAGAGLGSGPGAVPASVTVNVWRMPSMKCGSAGLAPGAADGVSKDVVPWGTKQTAK